MINVCRPRILIGTLKLKDSSWPASSTDIFSPKYLGGTWLPGSIYLDTWGVLGYQVVYTQIPGGYLATRQYIPGYLGGTWLPGSIYLETWGFAYHVRSKYLDTREVAYQVVNTQIPGGPWLPDSIYLDCTQGVLGYQEVYIQIPDGLLTTQYIPRYLGVLGFQVVYTQIVPRGYLVTRKYIPRYPGGYLFSQFLSKFSLLEKFFFSFPPVFNILAHARYLS